jgi:hypothetical protein
MPFVPRTVEKMRVGKRGIVEKIRGHRGCCVLCLSSTSCVYTRLVVEVTGQVAAIVGRAGGLGDDGVVVDGGVSVDSLVDGLDDDVVAAVVAVVLGLGHHGGGGGLGGRRLVLRGGGVLGSGLLVVVVVAALVVGGGSLALLLVRVRGAGGLSGGGGAGSGGGRGSLVARVRVRVGRARRAVVHATVDSSGGSDVVSLRLEGLALVVGTAAARLAHALVVLALLLPDLAVGATGGRSRVPALVELSPAVLVGLPAALLVAVVGDLNTAPVGVGQDAVVGLEAGGLLGHGLGEVLVVVGRLEDLGALDGERLEGLVEGVVLVGRVGHAGVAGDGNGGLGAGRSGRREVDLGAAKVVLGLVLHGDVVKGEELRADEVVATSKRVGNGDGNASLVLDHLLGAPLAGALIVALVPKLEPSITSGTVGGGVLDLLEVDGARTHVAPGEGLLGWVIGPLTVLESDLLATVHAASTGNTFGAVLTASHVAGAKVGDGVDGADGVDGLANASTGALSLAVDVDLGHDGVSGRAGHQGQSCSGVLHDCCLLYC